MNLRLTYLLSVLFVFTLIQNTFAQQTNYEVLFHNGITQLPENFKTDSDQLTFSQDEVFEGYYFRLIQFYANPNQSERQVMENMGLRFEGYVPHFTHLMAIPENFDWSQLEADKIRSVVMVDPSLKLDTKLAYESNSTPAMSGEHIELMLSYPSIFSVDQIEEACIENNITVMESSRYNDIMKVSMPLEIVNEKAALPFVRFIEVAPDDPILDDVRGRTLHRSNVIDSEYASGYHFNGEGVNVQVRDDGAIGPHIDFQGRVDNSYQQVPAGSHETRVAGTLGGAGNVDPYAKGMADGAFIFGTDYESTFLDLSMYLHFNEGVVITNSSYSDGCNDGYVENTATVDQQIFDNPSYIHVFSAGNSNNADCGYGAGNQWGNITGGHKAAKNCITTANIFYDGTIVESSSRGPAEDGRIKPDISAQGAVYAALPNNAYTETSGTSFSAPSVAGVLAQLYQAYKTWNGGSNPPSALMKACLLNTANDLGNPGPDYIYGWGHLNAYRAMKTIENNNYFADNIEEGMQNEHVLEIPADLKQIRIMTYWSDVPGTPFSAKALVNNLDVQLIAPDGTITLPYVLDPTPDPVTLNLPATNGVDDLNNVEQVVVDVPNPGNYTLVVNGTEVPMGPQEYFVLWEEVADEIMLTYPNGGECMSTILPHTIHWDAYGADGDFLLEYSSDGGVDWTTIATVDGALRIYDWTPPTDYTGLAMVRISRNGIEDMSNATFSLMNEPQNVEVTSACPDYISLTWDPVPGAVAYIAYTLGAQYMDSVAMTMTNTVDIPIVSLGMDNWYAVSSIGPDGACSPRTIAGLYNQSLLNCTLTDDAAILNGNICEGINYICEPFDEPLTVQLFNNGMNPQSDLTVNYTINGGPTVSEIYAGPLMPGVTVDYTFSETLNAVNGTNSVITWVEAAVDEFDFNNTITFSFTLEMIDMTSAPLNYNNDFQSGDFPPVDWTLNNFDGEITWEPRSVVGAFGGNTTAMYINNYTYSSYGEIDELITLPIDLSGATNPFLTFDVAYAKYNDTYADTMLISITTVCANSCENDIIYYKFADELATHESTSGNWEPLTTDDWRNEMIDLTAYAGQVVVLNFTNITGWGNSLYFDNVNVYDAVEPDAAFDVSQAEPCVFEMITISDSSEGAVTSFQWDFGADAIPATSNAAGPHEVYYPNPGMKTISLTVDGPLGSDVFTSTVDIAPQPEASFTFTQMDETYTFTNTSTLGNSYSWDFGDGNNSVDENPVHTYTGTGNYTITLSVTNDCGTTTFTEEVSIIVISTTDLEDQFQIALTPNPGTDEVFVVVEQAPVALNQIELYNATGQLVKTQLIELANTSGKYRVVTTELPAGTYWFKLVFETGTETKRWVKI